MTKTVRYAITHSTEYAYSAPVAVSHNQARLRPRALPHQRVIEQEVEVEPAATIRSRFRDYYGNEVDYFELREPLDVLRVHSRSLVERAAPAEAPSRDIPWESLVNSTEPRVAEFRYESPLVRFGESFRSYARESFPAGRPVFEAVRDLTYRIHDEFEFDQTATEVHTPVEDVLDARAGVCQDFAHVEIACLRAMGLAARYVSGYLRTVPPPGEERLVGADASHAWVAVHCGGDDWIEFDPTNDLVPGLGHVTAAWGRDYGDVPPVRGVLIGGGSTVLRVSVDVAPLDEPPPAVGRETAVDEAPAPAKPTPPASDAGAGGPKA